MKDTPKKRTSILLIAILYNKFKKKQIKTKRIYNTHVT